MCVWMLVAAGFPALMSVRESSGSKMAFALISNGRGGKLEMEERLKEGWEERGKKTCEKRQATVEIPCDEIFPSCTFRNL